MAVVEVGEHMVIDPEMVHGSLTFKGTRVPVSTVLAYIAKGESVDDVPRHWPQVSREAASEAVQLACEALHLLYAQELDAADDEARRRWDAAFGTNKVGEKAATRRKHSAEIEADFAPA